MELSTRDSGRWESVLALYQMVEKIKKNEELRQQLENELNRSGYKISRLTEQSNRKLVLITGHRREIDSERTKKKRFLAGHLLPIKNYP